jgi:dTMP kinase
MFFVFEGLDGAGKSTQLTLFNEWLIRRGHKTVVCKDPGSTQLGEELRGLLLQTHRIPIHVRCEMLMFAAARAQLVEEIIRPAIEVGKHVVCDRYIFSSIAYQGHGGGLDPAEIWKVNEITVAGLMPDLTLILDLPASIAARRMGTSLDRLENRGQPYFERVRRGFLAESARWPDRIEVVDADRPAADIQSDIQRIAQQYMDRRQS